MNNIKSLLILLITIISINQSFAQDEIEYNTPPRSFGDGFEIDCKDIISNEKYCKFKLVLGNTSKNNYLVYNLKKVGFEYDGIGVYYPKRGRELVVAPDKTESKIIKIDGDMDYRIGKFSLLLNGLKKAIPTSEPTLAALTIQAGDLNNSEKNGISITCTKFTAKKGKVSVNLEISFEGEDNQILSIAPNELQVVDMDGASIEASIMKKKKTTLFSGEKHKLKLSFKSDATSFQIISKKVFQLLAMSPVSVNKISVMSPNAMNSTVSSSPSSCEPFKGPQNAAVRVKFLNDKGVCFKLDVDGFPIIPNFTSNAIVYLNQGGQKLKVTLPNGTVVEKKIFIADIYEAVGYRIKEKRNGDYVINYAAFDQVMNEKGRAQQSAMMSSTKANTTNSSSVNNSNSSNTSSSSQGCFGSPSSGTTTVKLKITWKGTPVSGNDIQIKHGNAIVGNNTSDGSGKVSIKTSSLQSSKIDVYGCKGSNNWSVTGDWVTLDGSNYFHLKLDEVAAFMAEMMGMTADQIGAGWGF